jgi:hypothetical protein
MAAQFSLPIVRHDGRANGGVPRETAKSAGPGYTRHNTTVVAVQASGKGTLMLGSNMRLVIGGLAAVAVGIAGGWTLLAAMPVEASAPASVVETASVQVTAPAPTPDAATPTRAPAQTATPNPAPPTPPARTVAAPPAPDTAPGDDTQKKTRIHLDGERSELKYDGDRGGLHVNKDKVSVRTPYGKFELNW